jgi:hypothetical protein
MVTPFHSCIAVLQYGMVSGRLHPSLMSSVMVVPATKYASLVGGQNTKGSMKSKKRSNTVP